MNLIIDIGNTQIKFALFDASQIVNKGVGDVKDFQNFIKEKNINISNFSKGVYFIKADNYKPIKFLKL